MAERTRTLVIGYGNPGRRDDGLGAAFVERLEGAPLRDVTLDADYQLTVEDAAALAEHDVVVFVDAAVSGPAPFRFERLMPSADPMSFSTHSVRAEDVLALAHELFQATPEAFGLGIRGYTFDEFGEGLSARAQDNLAAALEFFRPILEKRTFSEGVTASAAATSSASSGDN